MLRQPTSSSTCARALVPQLTIARRTRHSAATATAVVAAAALVSLPSGRAAASHIRSSTAASEISHSGVAALGRTVAVATAAVRARSTSAATPVALLRRGIVGQPAMTGARSMSSLPSGGNPGPFGSAGAMSPSDYRADDADAGASQPLPSDVLAELLGEQPRNSRSDTLTGDSIYKPPAVLTTDEPPTAVPFTRKKKLCPVCSTGIVVDYKNIAFLSQFLSKHTGSILPRSVTGCCARSQAIKRARQMALLPYNFKHTSIPEYQ
ncbi:hypothetical protein CAOG_001560 [Capsaspora owczarzaki ATCC 30864]|uniref:30S ribosomal protein S18 n=1 Tax=Capsaspora owczarzaki (strain ATCC 30864) TaxID=595528 RepID=A0A0D2X155_CAPO3|nr:hypothetical protein CAOG_001560 [Capsaspora owczarzaki ATCC 30864]